MQKRKRRKSKAERKEADLRIRLTDDQKEEIEQGAARHDEDVSSWARRHLLRAARARA